jgi:hypothetical protein
MLLWTVATECHVIVAREIRVPRNAAVVPSVIDLVVALADRDSPPDLIGREEPLGVRRRRERRHQAGS